MKKILSFFLTLMMVLTLACSVSAEEGKGSITIKDVVLDTDDNPDTEDTLGTRVYSVYKLLDLESYNEKSNVYYYKAEDKWVNFFKSEATEYFVIDNYNYVTEKGDLNETQLAEFAQKALAYAQREDINIAPVATTKDITSYTIGTNSEGKKILKFADLDMGYYLVDSNVGVMFGLTTTDPHAEINAKNDVPTIDKEVNKDPDNPDNPDGAWDNSNTAAIGQTVEFRTTITLLAGAQNYVLHDKMDAGLTFNKVEKIEHIRPTGEKDENEQSVYQTKVLTEDDPEDDTEGDYTVRRETTEGCTFEVDFLENFERTLQAKDKIVVYYSAVLNENAVTGNEEGKGNSNEAWLNYGEKNETTHDKTTTYTFSIDLIKTDSMDTLIYGAKFRIYDALTGGTEVKVVKLRDENNNPIYRPAGDGETGVEIEVKGGFAKLVGFDNGTYYLEETQAPEGYNELASRQKFIIDNKNLDASFTQDGEIYTAGSGVQVINKSGTILPETGARGTALFITFGMIVVLGAGVLLVTKKRMGMIQD